MPLPLETKPKMPATSRQPVPKNGTYILYTHSHPHTDTLTPSHTHSVTVGASDESDLFAYFSNYGSCDDIIAPVRSLHNVLIGESLYHNMSTGSLHNIDLA